MHWDWGSVGLSAAAIATMRCASAKTTAQNAWGRSGRRAKRFLAPMKVQWEGSDFKARMNEDVAAAAKYA